MGAVLLTGVVVGRDCIVGAGAVLPGGKRYPAGHMILGTPGRVGRRLTDEEIEQNRQTTRNYVEYARRYRAEHPEG
jgi:carbonic anhydrase/acetyltransferase-like protein (isoleucine patch superfamily)